MVWVYAGFIFFILAMLALDLGVVNRKAHVIRAWESLVFTAFTVFLSLSFAVCVWWMYEHNRPEGITDEFVRLATQRAEGAAVVATGYGWEATIKYLTAWVLEYSLSVDNIFVIAVIFGYFRVPAHLQHRVLFWGILGALVMRGAMIVAGVELVRRFEWISYLFGLFLLYTAYKMFRSGEGEEDVANSPAVRLAQRLFPVTPEYHGSRFFVRQNGALFATPLFLALLVVEFTDVIFAVDSIPAIFAVTTDPFIVFTSNIFAILGLRALYFLLAGMMAKFRYLNVGLGLILAFVGVKMLIADYYKVPIWLSLTVIGGLLLGSVVASLLHPGPPAETPLEEETGSDAPGPASSPASSED